MKRSHRRLVSVVALLLAFLGVTILILPELARRLAIDRLEQELTVPVEIENVDINLFTGRATVENFTVGAAEPQPMLTVPLLAFEFSRLAALKGSVDLRSITIENPRLLLERLDASTYNVVQAIRTRQKPDEAQVNGTRADESSFAIRDFRIRQGEIIFIDHTQKPHYRLSLSDIDLSAGPISSLPGELMPTRFSAGVKIADGFVRVEGSSNLFGDLQETEVRGQIDNVKLNKFSSYLPYGGRLEVADSALTGSVRYSFSSKQGTVIRHRIDAALDVGALELKGSGHEDGRMARVAQVSARDISLDLLKKRMRIGVLTMEKPHLLVKRDARGFNLADFAPRAREKGVEKTALSVVIEKAVADSGTLEFIDETLSPAVRASLVGVALTGREIIVLPDFATGEITAQGQLGNGSMSLQGDIAAQPLRAKFSLTGDQLPFDPWRAYLNRLFTQTKFTGDTLGGELQIMVEGAAQDGIAADISGRLRGRNVALRFAGAENAFLTSQNVGVALGTIRLGSNRRVDIERIALLGARMDVVRGQQGQLNLAQLWAGAEAGKNAGAAEQQQHDGSNRRDQTGTTLAVRSITVEQGSIRIRDRSVTPAYTTTVSRLSGRLENLSPSAQRAELNLKGRLGADADLVLDGWFTPFSEQPRVQLKGKVTSYALPPLNPYATQYLSHRIRQGQISTEIEYTLKGDDLQASAGLVLRDLRLGEKTGDQFAQRIGIPLEVAVALLQDISGVIRLQLAMTSEAGLKIDVTELIWTAVRNAIIRAIAAPFRLVGNVLTLGGRIGGVRIDPVTFQPGSPEMESGSEEQIEQLAALLKDKPGLELKLRGNVSRSELDALKERRFWERIDNARGRSYQEALVAVYRELGGIADPRLPLSPQAEESLERFVMERLAIAADEQRKLAAERAQVVVRELRQRGIDPERLAVAVAETPSETEKPAVQIDIAA